MKCQRDSLLVSNVPRGGYLPLREAALWSGMSVKTLKRWIAKGLPRYQCGPREKVLIKLEDIDRFLTKKVEPQVDLDRVVDETLESMNLR